MTESRSYWDDRLRDHWNFRGVGMLMLSESYNRWLYRARSRVFRRVVRGLAKDWSGSVVLDVGVGTGFFLREWLSLGVRETWGLDISPTAIERLREVFPRTRLISADIGGEYIPEASERFDAISAFDVLFHVVDDAAWNRAIEQMARLLRSGGFLLLSDNFLRHGERRYASYWRSRSLDQYAQALSRFGLEIVERRPMFILMNAPVDTANPNIEKIWHRAMRVARGEVAGAIAGALLYPLELVLTAMIREGPSTELMVCRKR